MKATDQDSFDFYSKYERATEQFIGQITALSIEKARARFGACFPSDEVLRKCSPEKLAAGYKQHAAALGSVLDVCGHVPPTGASVGCRGHYANSRNVEAALLSNAKPVPVSELAEWSTEVAHSRGALSYSPPGAKEPFTDWTIFLSHVDMNVDHGSATTQPTWTLASDDNLNKVTRLFVEHARGVVSWGAHVRDKTEAWAEHCDDVRMLDISQDMLAATREILSHLPLPPHRYAEIEYAQEMLPLQVIVIGDADAALNGVLLHPASSSTVATSDHPAKLFITTLNQRIVMSLGHITCHTSRLAQRSGRTSYLEMLRVEARVLYRALRTWAEACAAAEPPADRGALDLPPPSPFATTAFN